LAPPPSSVQQRDAVYRLSGSARGRSGRVRIRITVRPAPNFYFPPVELTEPPLISGYVVPGLSATASGEICLGSNCRGFSEAPAYHDHNWGVWRDVTWEWGMARGRRLTVLYGGVYGPGRDSTTPGQKPTSPFFLTLVDSLGVKQVLRFDRIDYHGRRPASGLPGATAPTGFQLTSARAGDTLRLDVDVQDALATGMAGVGAPRTFLQMRGLFQLSGRVSGKLLADSGAGFFETYTQAPATGAPR
jgi:hypothetical protein